MLTDAVNSRLDPAFDRGAQRALAVRIWRVAEPFIVWIPPLMLVAPLMLLAVGSLSEVWDSRGLKGLSTGAYIEAMQFGGGAIAFSLQLASIVTAIVIVLAVPTAYALASVSGRSIGVLKQLLTLPVVLPPMALAIGMVLLYPLLSGTFAIFLLAHIILTLPFAVWPIAAALTVLDFRTLEKAARTLGATPIQSFRFVIIPNVSRAAVTGGVTAFVVSFAEVSAGLFLTSANYRPLSVALLGTFMDFDIRVAAALTMVFALLIFPALLLMELLLLEKRQPSAPRENVAGLAEGPKSVAPLSG